MKDLNRLIKFHRRAAKLTQAELASLAGVSRKVMQNLESGNAQVAWANVIAVLTTLNITLNPVGPMIEKWRDSLKTESAPHKSIA